MRLRASNGIDEPYVGISIYGKNGHSHVGTESR